MSKLKEFADVLETYEGPQCQFVLNDGEACCVLGLYIRTYHPEVSRTTRIEQLPNHVWDEIVKLCKEPLGYVSNLVNMNDVDGLTFKQIAAKLKGKL